jgi:hypothetical protein
VAAESVSQQLPGPDDGEDCEVLPANWLSELLAAETFARIVASADRKVGRGKCAREVRTTTIRIPKNKFSALISLGEYIGALNRAESASDRRLRA